MKVPCINCICIAICRCKNSIDLIQDCVLIKKFLAGPPTKNKYNQILLAFNPKKYGIYKDMIQ